jgi:hypothetical protein
LALTDSDELGRLTAERVIQPHIKKIQAEMTASS